MNLELSPQSKEELNQLCEVYSNETICVFTGAGVSFVKSKKYRTPGWWEFLADIYESIESKRGQRNQRLSFEILKKDNPHPWEMADFLEHTVGKEELEKTICSLLNKKVTTDLTYKRLPRSYLNNATTLNAVIAFCSHIRARRKNQCLEPNPKIKAVITLNYDCFLEAGATQKYNAFPFKPMSEKSSAPRPTQLPVYHIHGYAPYGHVFQITQQVLAKLEQEEIPGSVIENLRVLDNQKPLRKEKFTEVLNREIGTEQAKRFKEPILKYSARARNPKYQLVLTSESYHQAYSRDGFADKTLNHFLGQFSTLFIGVSFEDECLVKKLEFLNASGKPKHFALVHQDSANKIHKRLEGVNISLVVYQQHSQIPLLLRQIYKSPLESEIAVPCEKQRYVIYDYKKISTNGYWDLLMENKE